MRALPPPLRLLRIAIAIIALISPEPVMARIVASRPHALWTIPEGLATFFAVVPLTPWLVTVTTAVLRASAVLCVLGIFRRVALAMLAASLFYVFGAAQLTGTVLHDMHLFWFAALLACVRDESHDRLALTTARLWIGLVYFFPGVHKLTDGGLAWITSDNLLNQMHFKWYEAGGVAPWPRIDRFPHLVHAMAAAVVVFELTMPVLVMFRRTRFVAIVSAVLFHLAAGRFMNVLFPSLMACLVVLLPERTTRMRGARTAVVVAALFTIAIAVQGVRGRTQAFPFACYPTFATLAGDEIVDLAVDVGGTTYRLPKARRQDEWGMVWRLAGLYGDPIDHDAVRAFARTIAPPGRARVFAEAYSVRPEAWSEPPKRRWLLHED